MKPPPTKRHENCGVCDLLPEEESMGYERRIHRCRVPMVEGDGDLWRCNDCGDLWRSVAPGNPANECWRKVGWFGRWLHSRKPKTKEKT